MNRASLGNPSSFIRGLDLDLGPSASVSIPSGQVSALEVAGSLLDLGFPPEADPAIDPLEGLQRPASAGAAPSHSPLDAGAGFFP